MSKRSMPAVSMVVYVSLLHKDVSHAGSEKSPAEVVTHVLCCGQYYRAVHLTLQTHDAQEATVSHRAIHAAVL